MSAAFTPVAVRKKPSREADFQSAGRHQIAVRFDRLTWHELKKQAHRENVSIAEMVRRFVDAGLEARP